MQLNLFFFNQSILLQKPSVSFSKVTKSEKSSKLKVLLHLFIYCNSGHVIIHYYKGIEDF